MLEHGLTARQRAYIQDKFGIPVDSFHPGSHWVISLDAESLMPTDAELRQLQSFREYLVVHLYGGQYRNGILAQKLPKIAGHNTIIFRRTRVHQTSRVGWFYRKFTWEGTAFRPNPVVNPEIPPLSLVELLDRYENLLPERWLAWKTAHPDEFPYL